LKLVDPFGLQKMILLSPNKDQDLIIEAKMRRDIDGVLIISAHGGPTKIQSDIDGLDPYKMTAKEFARYLERDGWKYGYKKGMPIFLDVCRSGQEKDGKKSFAQDLAEELQVDVTGADSPMWKGHNMPWKPFFENPTIKIPLTDKTITLPNFPDYFRPGTFITYSPNGDRYHSDSKWSLR
jgi:hypothetical protein